MAAKIVVIVENQNARVFPCALAEEICGRQSADASADDDEVVILAGTYRISERIRAFAVPQAMGKGECSVVIAAHSHARRRVVVRRFFRSELIEGGRGKQGLRPNASSDESSSDADGHAVQEIPARDFAIHAQIFVFFLFEHCWSPAALHNRRL